MKNRLPLAILATTLSLAATSADPGPDTVLVKRGDLTVTAGDFYAYMEKIPENQRAYYRGDLERIGNGLSAIYLNRALAADARAQGIDKEAEFQRRLRITEEAMLAQVYLSRFEKAIVVPDFTAVAREKYKANPDRFKVPESVRLRQILVGNQGRTDEETRKRAEEARSRVLAGAPFDGNLAREYSTDPRAKVSDGLLEGPYSIFAAEVAAAARTIPLKQVSEPIKTSGGYYIIFVEERLPPHTRAYKDVEHDLVDGEERKFRRAAIEEKLGTITKSADIVMYTDQIAALQTEVDRAKLQEMHVDKAREVAEEKKRLLQQPAKPAAN